MKLRNKKTGEIIDIYKGHGLIHYDGGRKTIKFNSIEELEEWEDYEEPKEYWYIDCDGEIYSSDRLINFDLDRMANIGNCFETQKEAEKAVERLRAWKRLKDNGFKFSKDWVYRYDQPKVENHTYYEFVAICADGIRFDDLDLLFGGEE